MQCDETKGATKINFEHFRRQFLFSTVYNTLKYLNKDNTYLVDCTLSDTKIELTHKI